MFIKRKEFNMKKIILILLIAFGVILSGGAVSAKRELGKGAYINENGVKIFKKDYEKLVALGFVDREILQFTQEEYDRYTEKHIDRAAKIKYYIETETTEVNGEVVTKHKILDENTFYSEHQKNIKAKEKNDKSKKADNNIILKGAQLNDFSIMSTSETVTETSGFMVLTITATYDSCEGPMGEIFVKANLEWTSVPSQRYFDLLGIVFSSNLHLNQINNMPDFLTKFFYTKQTLTFNPLLLGYDEIIEEKSFIITPQNTEYYRENSNSIISRIPLPIDDSGHFYYGVVHYDFLITKECILIPNSTNIDLAEITGIYTHQYGHGSFEWDRVNMSLESPYFTYTESVLINDPTFMPPVVGPIEFEDMAAGHQFVVNHYTDTYHYLTCTECGYITQEDHVMVDGHCIRCDYHGHEHEYEYTSNGQASHTAKCTTCQVFFIEPHNLIFETNSTMHFEVCQDCGYKKSQGKHLFLLNGGKTCLLCGYTK
jgi:hypothetical protein